MTTNLLGEETSPYLLQHKDNPVHWRPWGPAALAEARQADKPVLLSIGYAACHWCHVMAHESFEDPATASVINDLFVAIKVDREERPDIDQIYQHALALLGQQGGWPLTMFLLPDGQPFWGGTYFPPTARWGRSAFADILRGVARLYREDRDRVTANVEALARGLARLAEPKTGGAVGLGELDAVAERFASAFDRNYGGMGGAPKFPNCSILELLWRGWRRTGEAAWREAVLVTLARMSQGGIYDHLGGGFARYSTDAYWLVPHFEKMLYDNAQLLGLLIWAWQETGDRLFRRRVEETIGWLLGEMRADGGAFAATLDADSEHEEGKFYVWTTAEIDQVLGADSEIFKTSYDVTAEGNWEGKTILNRSGRPAMLDEDNETRLAACRARLLAARSRRVRPARDDKVLADWNGLAIAALVQAAVIFEEDDWLRAAIEAWNFVTGTMMADGRLHHAWRLGRTHPGTLDDYAAISHAGLSLHEATGDARYLDQAVAWAEIVERHYAASGGYYLTADDTEALIARTKSAADSAVPSGNGLMLQVLVRLFALTAEQRYADRAEQLIAAFSGELELDFFGLGAYLNGVDFWHNFVQVVIVGDRQAADMKALIHATRQIGDPNLVIQIVAPGSRLPDQHPAFGKTQQGDIATAYVCRNRACSLPINEASGLLAQLSIAPTAARS